jgi:chromate reductase
MTDNEFYDRRNEEIHMINVLAFNGSLRKGSYNRMLLKTAQQLAPEDMQIDVADISEVPLYNGDVQDEGFPGVVQELGRQVKEADAILFVTPEYNYSIPGVLKNAIDWISRLPSHPFDDKPAAIMGASMGGFGTARSQYHLRQVLVFLNMHPLNKPEVFVSAAHEKFGANDELLDETARKAVGQQLVTLGDWTSRLARR